MIDSLALLIVATTSPPHALCAQIVPIAHAVVAIGIACMKLQARVVYVAKAIEAIEWSLDAKQRSNLIALGHLAHCQQLEQSIAAPLKSQLWSM